MTGKKHTLLRNALRSGFRAKERFLSLFGIIALSTGFFAGLKVTGKDMKDSAEQYYRDTALMDLHLVSDAGFCEEDLQQLAGRNEIAQLYGGYSETAYLPVSDHAADEIVKVYSLPENAKKAGNLINRPVVTEGRMPEQPYECLIETNTPNSIRIGDKLKIKAADERHTLLSVREYTVVGKADWSMYTDFQRGTTTLGNGSIDSFLLVPAKAFSSEWYTDVFLTLHDTENVNSFTEEYQTLVTNRADAILNDYQQLAAERIAQLRKDAETKLSTARKELDDGWAEYNSGSEALEKALKDGYAALTVAKTQLDATEPQITAAREAYDSENTAFLETKAKFEERERIIMAQEREANGSIEKMKTQISEIERAINLIHSYRNSTVSSPLPDDLQQIIDRMTTYDSAEFDLTGSMEAYFTAPVDSDEKATYEDTIPFYLNNCKVTLQNQIAQTEMDATQNSYGRNALEAERHEISYTEQRLKAAGIALEEQEAAYQQALSNYNEKKASLEQRDKDEHQQLSDAKQTLDDGEKEYKDGTAALETIADRLHWYAFDRSANPGWSSYGVDADRVNRIARIFPAFFVLVAALVCLTTMTRMVEEQRTEIGTCKALGYSPLAVSGQFLLYAALASILGTAIGTVIGFQVFPRVIFICYQMMYHYPKITCSYHWGYALGCLGAALLCTGVTALIACGATLRETPASLMRPKPPKKGKRILLERCKFIWKRCSFHTKVTLRNLFRYRSRILMTLIGICGCTALLVTGFGLYHAVSSIVDLQYVEVMNYDLLGYYDADPAHCQQLGTTLSQLDSVSEYQFGLIKSNTARVGNNSFEVILMVPEQPESFSSFVNMRDRVTHKSYTLDDSSVILNEKLARLLGIEAGGTIELTDAKHTVTVKALMENYAFNRICMTPTLYRELFGEYTANCFFANFHDGTDENQAAEVLLQTNAVQRLEFTSQSGQKFRNLVKALGYVVAVIILSSGLLALAVLYNLANINIIERKRELATLKVLGFYDREVNAYIFRENIISSALGMLLGLVAGIFLCHYVVQTSEVDVVMFAPDIPWICFVLAAAVTMCFTVLVNLILRRKLRAIDMAGSMKAIE